MGALSGRAVCRQPTLFAGRSLRHSELVFTKLCFHCHVYEGSVFPVQVHRSARLWHAYITRISSYQGWPSRSMLKANWSTYVLLRFMTRHYGSLYTTTPPWFLDCQGAYWCPLLRTDWHWVLMLQIAMRCFGRLSNMRMYSISANAKENRSPWTHLFNPYVHSFNDFGTKNMPISKFIKSTWFVASKGTISLSVFESSRISQIT